MSVVSEINRINTNIANAYSKCNEKGATMPQIQNSSNLASTIDTISGEAPISITTLTELNNSLSAIYDNYINFLNDKINNYPVYTQQPITLYVPENDYNKYAIHKTNNGKYRILWFKNYSFVRFVNDTSIDFRSYGYDSSITGNLYFKNIDEIKENTLPIKITNIALSNLFGGIYYSNNFNTINEVINAITSPNGTITYTKWTNGQSFSTGIDTPYMIPYTNVNVIDDRNGTLLVVNSQRLSKNETFITK